MSRIDSTMVYKKKRLINILYIYNIPKTISLYRGDSILYNVEISYSHRTLEHKIKIWKLTYKAYIFSH